MHLREISYHSYFFVIFYFILDKILYHSYQLRLTSLLMLFTVIFLYIFSIDVMSHVHQELTVANANQLANVKMEDLVILCLENAIVQRGGR